MTNIYLLISSALKFSILVAKRWYVVLASIALCSTCTFIFMLVKPAQYTSEMVVVSAETGGSSLSSAMSSLAGSSLLGLALGRAPTSKFDNYLSLLQSNAISETLLKNQNLLGLLFGKSLDPKTGQWVPSFSRSIKSGLNSLLSIPTPTKPTISDVQYILNAMLVINTDPLNKNMATITCSAANPVSCPVIMKAASDAAQLRLDQLAQESASVMKNRLGSLVDGVEDVTLREALTTAAANASIQEAISSIGQDTITVLDGPTSPRLPSFPKPILLLKLAVFMGILLGILMCWILENFSIHRQRSYFLGSKAE